MATARRAGPSRYCRLSIWWMPSWVRGPPGVWTGSARQSPSLSSRPRSFPNTASTMDGAPASPLASMPFMARSPDRRRALCPQANTIPEPSTAARIRRRSARATAAGFSVYTCLPRAAAASMIGACWSFGAVIRMPSTSSRASSASSDSSWPQPKSAAKACRRSGLRVKQVRSSARGLPA